MQLQSRILAILLISQLGADASSSEPTPEVYSHDTWANIRTLPTDPRHPYSVYTEVVNAGSRSMEIAGSSSKQIPMGIIVTTLPKSMPDMHNIWKQAFEQIKAIWSSHKNRCGGAIYIPYLPVHDKSLLLAAIEVLKESGVKLAFDVSIKRFIKGAEEIIGDNTDLFEYFEVNHFGRLVSHRKFRPIGTQTDISNQEMPVMFVLLRNVKSGFSSLETYINELKDLFNPNREYAYYHMDSIDERMSATQAQIVAGILRMDVALLRSKTIRQVLGGLVDIDDSQLTAISLVLDQPETELRELMQHGSEAAGTGIIQEHVIAASSSPQTRLEELAQWMGTSVENLQVIFNEEDLQHMLNTYVTHRP